MAGDITRITLNVLNLANSEYIDTLSDAELGQWMRLFCKSVLLAKECTLPIDEKTLAGYTKLGRLSQRVLEAYPIVHTEYGDRRRNAVLYAEWVQVCGKSEEASRSAKEKWERLKAKKALDSAKNGCERTADAEDSQSDRNANRTEHNRTEEKRREDLHPISAAMNEMAGEQVSINLGGLKPGEPGFFCRGQYPGTSMKHIWQHCERAWIRAKKSNAAVCRFPTKHPAAKTFVFEDLCTNHSADLIVPAFELWIQAEGKFIETQWPLSEFLKGTNPQDYMSKIIPLNAAQPKITKSQIDMTDLNAKIAWCKDNPGHEVIDGQIVEKLGEEIDQSADALFGPEETV